MLNIKVGEFKKIIKKKKYLQVFNMFKQQFCFTTITNHIFDLKIN